MQLSFNKESAGGPDTGIRTLAELRFGQAGIIEGLALPENVSARLMELGFLPGAYVEAGRSAPGGDPMVFRVDGCEIAIRRDTARGLRIRSHR